MRAADAAKELLDLNIRRGRSLEVVRRQNSTWHVVRFLALRAAGSAQPLPVRLGGHTVLVRPTTSDLQVAYSCLVKGEFDAMARAISPDSCSFVVDAGGYIGTAALAFARMFPKATVVTLEPSSENFQLLKRNVAGTKNIVPINKALLGTARKVKLTDHELGAWAYSVAGGEVVGATKELETVDGITMEELMRDFGVHQVDVLKMDIEGSEREVFRHSQGWMPSCRAVIAELHDDMVPGCAEAYRAATAGMRQLEIAGEKVAAVRD